MSRAAVTATIALALNLARLGLLTAGLLALGQTVYAYTADFYLGITLFALGCYLSGITTPTQQRKTRPTRTDEETRP